MFNNKRLEFERGVKKRNMSNTIQLLVGNCSATTTVQQIKSVSKILSDAINQKSKTIKIVSKYNDQVNSQFIGYLTGSIPVFTEKYIVEVASLFEQYKCEKLLSSAVDYIKNNVPLDKILFEYVELSRNHISSPVFEKILVESIITPQTILFEESFTNLPVVTIEQIFSSQSDFAIPPSLLFAFILLQIQHKQQGVEPLLRFLDYTKLILPQLNDLKETLLKYHLDSLAYLVIQMIKIRNSSPVKRPLTRFEKMLELSTSFIVEYSPSHEFDGVFKMLSKEFGQNLITCGAVTLSSSSNDPMQILGGTTSNKNKNRLWVSGNENNPYFQIDSDVDLCFNQFRFTGLPETKPEDYAIEISDDCDTWTEVVRVRPDSGLYKLAAQMDTMATNVKKPKHMAIKRIGEECQAKHVRLVNYGKNSSGSNKMSLTSFELYRNGIPLLGPLKSDLVPHLSVRSSSCSYPSLLDMDKTGFWSSLNIPNSYLQLTFNEFAIAITGYTLQTYSYNKDMDHLKQWVLLGSLDGQKWVELDRQEPNEDLNGGMVFKYYKCKRTRPCKHVRIQIEGENHNRRNILVLSSIEVFGLILPDLN